MKKTNEELKKIIFEKSDLSDEDKLRIFNNNYKDWQTKHEYIYKRFNINFNDKILDIGCSFGHNLIHFSQDSVGIEIQQPIINFLNSLGLNVKSINVEDDLRKMDEKFDLIWCTDFLVHTISPYKFLYDCRHVLNDNGRIVIQIPLMSIWNTHRSSCHFYGFNKKALLYIFEMSGYKIIKTSGLIRKLPSWLNKILEPVLQIWGGNIWVLAEKQSHVPINTKKVYPPSWFKL